MEPQEFQTMLSDMGLELVSSHFGSGTLDGKADTWQQATMLSRFEELVEKAAEEAGMKHYLIEQESFTQPPMESIKMNYEYLLDLKV